MTAEQVEEHLLNSRFYLYQRPDGKWNIYENMYDEGPQVKKRLASFEKKEDAESLLTVKKAAFMAELAKHVRITNVSGVSGHRDHGAGPEHPPDN